MWVPDLADAGRMASLLRPHADALGLHGGLAACRLVDARLSNPHLPGTPRCHGWATYELVGTGSPAPRPATTRGPRPRSRTWYLEAHPEGTGGPVWAAYTAAHPATAARFLPDLDVVAWPFPVDPALPLLSDLLHPGTAQRHLPASLRGRAGDVRVTAVDVVRYQPRASAVLRVALGDGTAVYAKLVDRATVDVAAVAGTHTALHARTAADGPLRVAEPLGADPGRGLLWTRAVEGRPLLAALLAGADVGTSASTGAGTDADPVTTAADDVAALVAALHGSGVARGPGLDLGALADEARKKVAKMAVAHPAAAARLAALLDRVPELAARAAPDATEDRDPSALPTDRVTDLVTVHGDLHVDQLLDTPDGPVLLDLDSVARGPADLDLAELVVDLVLRDLDPGVAERFVPRLLATYAGHRAGACGGPGALDGALLRALADAEFVNRCYRHLRRHLPGWPADLERELDRHPRVTALLPG